MVLRRLIKWTNIIAGHRRTEQVMRHLAMITEQAGEGIIVMDLEGTLRFVNTTWARMHGYSTSRELVGKHISLFHTKEQLKNSVIAFIKAAKSKGRCSGQAEHVRMDGTIFQTQMKMNLVNDEAGKALGFIVLVTDITKRRKLEETLSQATKEGGQLKQQIEQLQRQTNEHAQADGRFKQQAAELASANEQLQRQINEHAQAEERLKQQAAELASANEQLQRQTNEHAQADGRLKQQAAESTSANEQLQRQINEHAQADGRLKQQAAESTSANEQLRHQINEHAQAEERLKQQAAELASSNEQLKRQIAELERTGETLRQTTELTEESEEEMAPPLDDKKLKELSEMAKRLTYPR